MNKFVLIALSLISVQTFAASSASKKGLTLVTTSAVVIPMDSTSVEIANTGTVHCEATFHAESFGREIAVGDEFKVLAATSHIRQYGPQDFAADFRAQFGFELNVPKNANLTTMAKAALEAGVEARIISTDLTETHVVVESKKTSRRMVIACSNTNVDGTFKTLNEHAPIKPSKAF